MIHHIVHDPKLQLFRVEKKNGHAAAATMRHRANLFLNKKHIFGIGATLMQSSIVNSSGLWWSKKRQEHNLASTIFADATPNMNQSMQLKLMIRSYACDSHTVRHTRRIAVRQMNLFIFFLPYFVTSDRRAKRSQAFHVHRFVEQNDCDQFKFFINQSVSTNLVWFAYIAKHRGFVVSHGSSSAKNRKILMILCT